MLDSIHQSPLYAILNPKSIAFYGASDHFSAMGTSQLLSIMDLGFQGPIYPIHPKLKYVQGLKAYKTIMDVPEVPELAVMVLPTHVVPDTMEECGRKGVRNAIVVSGGFVETGHEGAKLQLRLVNIAKKYKMRFVGPNCIGVVNPYHKLNTTFFPYETSPGFIGMASQSGSFVTQMFDYLAMFGLGFSTAISVGNEADIDMVDCLEYLGSCPHTKVIALYIEAIRRGRQFIKVAREISQVKPIVAFYVGGSEAGKQASLSHTGALAGPDKLYGGVFAQSGVIRARSVEELFDYCWVLGSSPLPSGNKVVIQTHSGGPGAAAADACDRAGLMLPSLGSKTKEQLRQFVPHTGSIGNPVDLTFTKNPLDYFNEIPRTLLMDPSTDSLLIYFLVPTKTLFRSLEQFGVSKDRLEQEAQKIIDSQALAVSELQKSSGKPILGFSFRTRSEAFIKALQDKGIPVLHGPARAASALGALVKYASWKKNFT